MNLLRLWVLDPILRARVARAAGLAVVLAFAPCAFGSETKTVAASDAEIERAMAGKRVYTFTVLAGDALKVPDGTDVRVGDLKSYLKRTKPDKEGFFVVWVQDPAQVPAARAAIEKLADYGAYQFAIKRAQVIGPAAGDAPADGGGGGKSLVVLSQANPKAITSADKPPAMTERPEVLRPGKLPRGVRYKFAADAEMVSGAELVSKLLVEPDASVLDGAFGKVALVMPGAWKYVEAVEGLKSAKPLHATVPLGKRVLKLQGGILQSLPEFQALVQEIRRRVREDGGARVRALTTEEMSRWWMFISLDIQEPVYVVETKARNHRFVVTLSDAHLLAIDDLDGLPPL